MKSVLSSSDAFELRQVLQVAVLEALLAGRRWGPGELVFQGGTSLHLVHGSPRFSEDLDFLVDNSLKLGSISRGVQRRLAGAPWLPKGSELRVSKARDGHNPHSFDVTVGGANWIGAVRVRVELRQTLAAALSPLAVTVAPVRLLTGLGAGAQAMVPASDTSEIYADKVFAVAARPYLKARDVFDLHWLQSREPGLTCSPAHLRVRLATYPNQNPAQWLVQAKVRRAELEGAATAVARDLARWLPSSWPLTTATVQAMLDATQAALAQGVAAMGEVQKLAETPARAPARTRTRTRASKEAGRP